MNGPSKLRTSGRRASLALLAFALLACLLTARTAAASGSFKLRSTSVTEVSGGWHVYCEVALPKPPDIAHPTLKFLLTKTAVYERDLIDGHDKPVTNRQSLVGQNPSVESLEVSFSDASGKIFNTTHFDFSLTRARGYEAGEYKVQVKTSDGADVGTSATLTLNGDNPVVDRRAMSFDTKNPGMKKVAGGVDAGTTAPKVDETVAAAPNNGDVTPAGTAPPFLSADAFKTQPEELHEHPKGCGCDVPGVDPGELSGGARALLLLCTGLGLSAIGWRKRRT